MKKVMLLWLVAGSLLLVACTPSANVPLPAHEKSLSVHELPNGLTITLKEQHALPLVTIQFWIRVGSRNEPNGQQGIAHIFEHIWFKGTATQPVGSFHRSVESVGGELNAMTSHDWTMYFVTVPRDKFNVIFPLMVDLLKNPAFNETEIEKEKEVVTEEQRFQYNEPERYTDEQFGLLLLDSHPYRHPIIGYKDTILSQTKETISSFYDTWYVPNNMNIVVAGDIDSDEILQTVSAAFSDLAPKELPAIDFPKEPPRTDVRYNSSFRNVGYAYSALGYIAPNARSPDKYPFIVLNTLFSVGDSSRMNRILKQEKEIIVRGNSVYAPLMDTGVFETLIVTEPEKRAQAIAELLLQIQRLKTEPVTPQELARAKAVLLSGNLRSQEDLFQVGFDIGEAWVRGDLGDYTELETRVNAVTSADVQRVAQNYFTQHTLYEVKPKP
ncbi:insulinase family protein [Candidatus Woesearchaeota archaeon]|nr:MAG: insulinase family protein [Candidatus Woesearchaeota archaeon]